MRKNVRLATIVLGLAAASPAAAQDVGGRCVVSDSIRVVGNSRIDAATVITDANLVPGAAANYTTIQRAIRALFETGQFDDVRIDCELVEGPPLRTVHVIRVVERPILDNVDVVGPSNISLSSVRDRVDLLIGRAVNPANVATDIGRIDSLYQSRGYWNVRVQPETTVTAANHVAIVFRVDEGRKLAISGIRVNGASALAPDEVVGALKIRPEGFFWWRRGEFDAEKYAQDLGERLPKLYADRGFIDFQVERDTMLVDREHGKALIDLSVREGKEYRLGTFEVTGNRRYATADLARYYPFGDSSVSLTRRLSATLRRQSIRTGFFNQSVWDEGTEKLRNAYANDGFIYSQVRPIVDRAVGPDSQPVVNLRWDIVEGQPAIINRIEILGNDYTSESCIRDQLVIIPGDVFSRDRLVRSWQSIGNLGFFEAPILPPETRQANEQGDIDIVFRVKEKRTGNVSFGASMGQGTGIGGFIGLDQPNLLGKCKKGSLNWQFGRYINDFQLSYTDPSIKLSRFSGTVLAYRSQSRFTIADLGQTTRIGANVRVGFPFMNSRFTRVFASYGAESVRHGNFGLLGTVTTDQCAGCYRSTLGTDITRDTRIGVPFPIDGVLQTVSGQFNGGPLGGSASFQRYTSEFRAYTTLAAFGDGQSGERAVLVAGVSQKSGFVFGDPGPFFSSQSFALGGVQYGEALRGYPEFSITPDGFNSSTGTNNAVRQSFGNAFFTTNAEIGFRISSQFYVNAFVEAGNIWARPRQFNPTRLFRGAGIGASAVTPLGPLGLDWAYGFDRVNDFGNPAPKWQVHFRLGQFFY
ncbi:MAG: outer membrane protein assembly factor BamA [Gemmatimonadetes bacterium]|nr:outer membrane protein assembly factor BamA [Gemmatimonadota bacterium]